MPKYVAFLRAINVGGHVVKMDRLRTLFEGLGLTYVETFIASGNVIFDASTKNTKSLERKIEKHLQDELGYPVVTFVRAITDLPGIIDYKPFDKSELEAEGNVLYVGFLAESPGDAAIKVLRLCATEVDLFQVSGREVYWLLRTKFSDSQFSGARLEKTLGMPVTLRNLNTIKRIAAKYL
ncbi:MAG: DUF1697 domain-containing protein [Acidobacteriota bacterium]|nr:DUF1697 domain-containing protein [Acidobacteriota bacterium]